MTDARYAALQAFIEQCLGADVQRPEPASSDASFRRYWRVQGAGGSHIIMDAPPDKENCGPFIDVSARLVQAGLRAPAVLAQDLEHGFLLLDDLGTRTLLQDLRAARQAHDRHCRGRVGQCLLVQTIERRNLPEETECIHGVVACSVRHTAGPIEPNGRRSAAKMKGNERTRTRPPHTLNRKRTLHHNRPVGDLSG